MLTLLTFVASVGAQQPSDTLGRIDSLFAPLSATGPGCAVGIGRDGNPPIERAYGMASLEYGVPNTPLTIFHAGSIAKQFTAAAIVTLARQGKLSLDDDVRRYLPELPTYGATITLAQLMHHTSGLRDENELLWLAGGRDDDPTELEDVLAMIRRQRGLNFAPGTQHLYSNTGYTLLGLVVQRVSGKPLKDFAAEELFAPRGMAHTQFVDNRFAIVPGRATGYRSLRDGSWGHVAYLADTYGEAGLFTTIDDLLRWNAGLADFADALQPARLSNGTVVPYSMGLEHGTYRGEPFLAHGGNTMGEAAYAMRFPGRRLSVAVLCNGREIDAFTLARQTAGIFIGPAPAPAAGPTEQAAAITLTESQLKRFAGLYYNPATMTTRTVGAHDGRLYWVRGGPGIPLDAIAENRFRFPPGQPAELLFPTPARGQPQELQVLSGGTVTSYRRAAPFGKRARANEYGGRFHSDEVDVTLYVTATDSAIEVSTPGSWRFRAEPLFKDAFAVSEAAVFRFVRTKGRVTGMVVDMARTRGVRFIRVPDR